MHEILTRGNGKVNMLKRGCGDSRYEVSADCDVWRRVKGVAVFIKSHRALITHTQRWPELSTSTSLTIVASRRQFQQLSCVWGDRRVNLSPLTGLHHIQVRGMSKLK